VPLFVNEDRSDEKLRAIRNSDYLSWCLGQLAGKPGICLFGQHLDSSDQHLLDAIRQARPKQLSIAIRPLSEASVINQKQHFVDRFADLAGTTLHFFDASTHPLGQAHWRSSRPCSTLTRPGRPAGGWRQSNPSARNNVSRQCSCTP
jgi:hypothetical protein